MAHKLAAQPGQSKKPVRQDPERWMDVSTGIGIRMAISPSEKQELGSIYLRLDDILAEKLRTYLGGAVEPEFSLEV
ncbi:hypothetical protein [Nitrobacter sp. JJSN]|uniref:hypothetical protein n=1 Tax=Nitrobacter sp. JJSN TaxID=3453033 RepID=UPI003F75721B